MELTELEVPFKLHPAQQEVFNLRHKYKYRVLTNGRRWGKSYLGITESVIAAMEYPEYVNPRQPKHCLLVLPTINEATAIVWKPLKAWCENELAPIVKHIDTSNKEIQFYGGRPSIAVRGANDADGRGLVGWSLVMLYADEFQNWRPGRYNLIRPALADTPGSRVLITGTPRGKLNGLYEQHQMAEVDPVNYKSFTYPTWTNPLPSLRDQVEADKATMPEKIWRQEYMASFESFEGKIYYELDSDNLVDRLPESFDFAALGVDWGSVHPALTCWGMSAGRWYHLESWRNDSGVAVPLQVQDNHAVRLCLKYPVKATFCDPSQESLVMRLREIGKERGIAALDKEHCISGYNRVPEGIAQVHSLISDNRLLVPRRDPDSIAYPGRVFSKDIYTQLESYHWDRDRNGTVLDGKVEDGQDDHCLDALRYLIARRLGG